MVNGLPQSAPPGFGGRGNATIVAGRGASVEGCAEAGVAAEIEGAALASTGATSVFAVAATLALAVVAAALEGPDVEWASAGRGAAAVGFSAREALDTPTFDCRRATKT